MLNGELARRINRFWFGDMGENGLCSPETAGRWFTKSDGFDRLVEEGFGAALRSVKSGEPEGMTVSPRGALGFIILTDQFPRNIHRGKPEAFAFDGLSLAVCRRGVEKGFDGSLFPVERVFFYMPLMHSESLAFQKISVRVFSSLAAEFGENAKTAAMLKSSADYARRHFEIIKRFGRYPHRNAILGRESTPEEAEFLKRPGSSF